LSMFFFVVDVEADVAWCATVPLVMCGIGSGPVGIVVAVVSGLVCSGLVHDDGPEVKRAGLRRVTGTIENGALFKRVGEIHPPCGVAQGRFRASALVVVCPVWLGCWARGVASCSV
jgi:hypothetical protein